MNEREPVPSEMISVKRYFADLAYKNDSFFDIQVAVEKLLDREGLDVTVEGYNTLYGSVLPSIDQHEQSRIIATDMFLAFPVEFVAPWIDAAKPIAYAKEWHEQAILGIHNSTMTLHKDDCYSLPEDESLQCPHNAIICPRRVLSTYLQQEVRHPDFTAVEYMIDPYRTHEFASMKFMLAAQLRLDDYHEFQAELNGYDKEFAKAFK